MNHHLGLGGTWLVGEILIIRRSLDNVRVLETCTLSLTRYSAFLAGFGAFVKIRRPFSSSPNLWALVVARWVVIPVRETTVVGGSNLRQRGCDRRSPMKNNVVKKCEIGTKKENMYRGSILHQE